MKKVVAIYEMLVVTEVPEKNSFCATFSVFVILFIDGAYDFAFYNEILIIVCTFSIVVTLYCQFSGYCG
jgi:hypothetical protein